MFKSAKDCNIWNYQETMQKQMEGTIKREKNIYGLSKILTIDFLINMSLLK